MWLSNHCALQLSKFLSQLFSLTLTTLTHWGHCWWIFPLQTLQTVLIYMDPVMANLAQTACPKGSRRMCTSFVVDSVGGCKMCFPKLLHVLDQQYLLKFEASLNRDEASFWKWMHVYANQCIQSQPLCWCTLSSKITMIMHYDVIAFVHLCKPTPILPDSVQRYQCKAETSC